jgi:hypothetical protein
MKLSAISFNEADEPLLAKVVSYLRAKGTLGRIQKLALINEAALDAILQDPNSTFEERMDAIALVQSSITARQSLIDIYLRSISGSTHKVTERVPALVQTDTEKQAIATATDDDDDDVSDLDNY